LEKEQETQRQRLMELQEVVRRTQQAYVQKSLENQARDKAGAGQEEEE
jgi:hypothetical protein